MPKIDLNILERLRQNDPYLVSLSLSGEKLKNKDIKQLVKALRGNTSLRVLDLSYNKIKDEGANYLAEFLKTNTSLQELDLGGNKIRSDGGKALIAALKQNKESSLIWIGFVYNNGGDYCDKIRDTIVPMRKALFELQINQLYHQLEKVVSKKEIESLYQSILEKLNDAYNFITNYPRPYSIKPEAKSQWFEDFNFLNIKIRKLVIEKLCHQLEEVSLTDPEHVKTLSTSISKILTDTYQFINEYPFEYPYSYKKSKFQLEWRNDLNLLAAKAHLITGNAEEALKIVSQKELIEQLPRLLFKAYVLNGHMKEVQSVIQKTKTLNISPEQAFELANLLILQKSVVVQDCDLLRDYYSCSFQLLEIASSIKDAQRLSWILYAKYSKTPDQAILLKDVSDKLISLDKLSESLSKVSSNDKQIQTAISFAKEHLAELSPVQLASLCYLQPVKTQFLKDFDNTHRVTTIEHLMANPGEYPVNLVPFCETQPILESLKIYSEYTENATSLMHQAYKKAEKDPDLFKQYVDELPMKLDSTEGGKVLSKSVQQRLFNSARNEIQKMYTELENDESLILKIKAYLDADDPDRLDEATYLYIRNKKDIEVRAASVTGVVNLDQIRSTLSKVCFAAIVRVQKEVSKDLQVQLGIEQVQAYQGSADYMDIYLNCLKQAKDLLEKRKCEKPKTTSFFELFFSFFNRRTPEPVIPQAVLEKITSNRFLVDIAKQELPCDPHFNPDQNPYIWLVKQAQQELSQIKANNLFDLLDVPDADEVRSKEPPSEIVRLLLQESSIFMPLENLPSPLKDLPSNDLIKQEGPCITG